MLTGRQIRQARKLLHWSRGTLGLKTSLPIALFDAVESSDGPAWLTDKQEASIRRACEKADISFEVDAEGLPTAVWQDVPHGHCT